MGSRGVVVTGASTGIGLATVTRLAADGWRVWAGVRKDADAERLGRIAGVEPVIVDVADEDHIAALAALVEQACGPAGLHGLVNNAGIGLGGPVETLSPETWRQQLEVNVVGQAGVTAALLPALRRAKGRLVFIGSVAGRVAPPAMAPYAASKHAIEAIAGSLRHELRPSGVKVVVVEPGAVATPIWEKSRGQVDEILPGISPELRRTYAHILDTMRAQMDKQEGLGIPADDVAKVIEKALTTGRPRARYPVGKDAKMAALGARFLPDTVLDRVVATMTKA